MPLIQLKQMLRITHSLTPMFIVYIHLHARIYAYTNSSAHIGRKKRTFKSTITLPLKSLHFYFWQLKLIGHQTVDPPSVLANRMRVAIIREFVSNVFYGFYSVIV